MLYTNTVIPQTASKSHNIYILSLFEKNPNLYSNQFGISYGSSVNVKGAPKKYPAYVWDLYKLASLVGNFQRFDHYTISQNNPWRTILAGSFGDDSGSEIYSNLSNFLPLVVNNHPKYTGHVYSCNLTFSPLLNIRANNYLQYILSTLVGSNQWLFPSLNQFMNDQAAAELIIYLATKIPLYPLMLCSSISSHYSFGPVFLNRFTIQASGSQNASAVEVTCSFLGGKALISPEINLLLKRKPGIEPIVYNSMNDLNGNPIGENATNYYGTGINYDYHRYRSYNFLDVIVANEYIDNFGQMLTYPDRFTSDNSNILKPPPYKIIDVSMTVDQNIDLTFTNPVFENNYKGDKFGPRFASLKSRSVSGTIKYFGYNKTERIPNSSGLTIYFGGPFYYAMKNVDWSNPQIEITPSGGYIHTYNFKARLPSFPNNIQDINEIVSFPDLNDNFEKTVSEFSYKNFGFTFKDYLDGLLRNTLDGFGIQLPKI
jgi:hypothetical protein